MLPSQSFSKASKILNGVLIVKNLAVMAEIFSSLLRERAMEGLAVIYKLHARLEAGLDSLRVIYEKFIASQGMEFIEKLNFDDAQFEAHLLFKPILEMYAKFAELNSECFANDSGFIASMDKVIQCANNTGIP